MVVGIGTMIFRLHGVYSLKEKRGIVKSMISRLHNSFNISIAEVGANDSWERAEIGFSMTGNDSRVINSKMDKVFNMAEEMGLAEMINYDMEIISF
jgi:uncharacterized protein YlxP (DUF503 family)